MKKLWSIFLAAAAFIVSADDLSTEDFMARVRSDRSVETYAKLTGVLQHKRLNEKAISLPLYVGLIIQKNISTGQLVLDDEFYLIGQSQAPGTKTVLPMQKTTEKLDNSGLQASDLTLSFIYDPILKEEEKTRLRGVISCRVIRFKSTERDEEIRVFIAENYFFPLKAEFFKPGEDKPYRVLEIVSFEQKNNLYYASTIRLEGPGWRTRIDFDTEKADLGVYNRQDPPDIMKKRSL